MRRTRITAGILTVAAGITLAGCSLFGQQAQAQRPDPAQTPQPTTTQPPTTQPPTTPTLTEQPAPAPPAAPGQPLATRDTANHDIPLRVDLTEARRSGDLVNVNFTVTNLAQEQRGRGFQISRFFDDGLENFEDNANFWTADGLYLIDTTNQKKHPVARDAQTGECLCSGDLKSIFLEAGQTVGLTATFGAPPADITAVDISIPHTATFTNVPLG